MIHKVEKSDTEMRVWQDAVTMHVYGFADLIGATDSERAADLQARIQADLDVRIPRSMLTGDDPDKATNPAQPDLFWDGADLVARSVIVTVAPTAGSYDAAFEAVI